MMIWPKLPLPGKELEEMLWKAPARFVMRSGETAMGLVASLLSGATGGGSELINRDATELTKSSVHLLTDPYLVALKILRPDYDLCESRSMAPDVILEGSLVEHTSSKLFRMASESRRYTSKDSPLATHASQQLASRLLYLSGGLVAIVARTSDLALGLFCAVVSLGYRGEWEECNQWAFRQLQGTALFADLAIAFRGLVHPGQFETTPSAPLHHSFKALLRLGSSSRLAKRLSKHLFYLPDLLIGAPSRFLLYSGEVLLGLGCSLLSCATLGRDEEINKRAHHWTDRSFYLLTDSYEALFRFCFPDHPFAAPTNPEIAKNCINSSSMLVADKTGLLSQLIENWMNQIEWSISDSSWLQWGYSKLALHTLSLLNQLLFLLTRLLDLLVALLLVPLSIAFHLWMKDNSCAFYDWTVAQLRATCLVADVANAVRCWINPDQSALSVYSSYCLD